MPVVGQRIVLTQEGQDWEVTKSGRGDQCQGQPGTLVDIAEGICCVRWDATNVVHRYPAGVMNRFYLAIVENESNSSASNVSVSKVPHSEADRSNAVDAGKPADPARTVKVKDNSLKEKSIPKYDGHHQSEDSPKAKPDSKAEERHAQDDHPAKPKDRKRKITKVDTKASSAAGQVEAKVSPAVSFGDGAGATDSPSSSVAMAAPSSVPAARAQSRSTTNPPNADDPSPQMPHDPAARGPTDPNSVLCRFLIGGRWKKARPRPAARDSLTRQGSCFRSHEHSQSFIFRAA